MTARARRLAVAAAALAAACGGDRAAGPTPPRPSPPARGLSAGATLTVVRGDTGAAVPGATVTVAGRAYVADAAGAVRIEAAADPGALVDVVAPPVLDRQTVVRSEPLSTLTLWPRVSAGGMDENFTAAVVYTRSGQLGTVPPGTEPLRRFPPAVGQVVVVPTAEILDDERAHAAHITALARLNAATRGTPAYVLAREAPPAATVFPARIEPGNASCGERVLAFARLSLRAGEITGGEIVFCQREAARVPGLVVHELGHTFGLQHSDDSRDMMFGTFHSAHADDFRPREVEVMALVMQRRAGNRFPDSDREVSGASSRMDDIIVCY